MSTSEISLVYFSTDPSFVFLQSGLKERVQRQKSSIRATVNYFHGVLIKTCNFLVACSCVGMDYSRAFSVQYYSFSAIRGSHQSIDCCQLPPTNVKRLEPTNPWEVFANSWICFIKRPCLNFGLYPVAIACLQSEIDTGLFELTNSFLFAC